VACAAELKESFFGSIDEIETRGGSAMPYRAQPMGDTCANYVAGTR
jgi:hypothetical protein